MKQCSLDRCSLHAVLSFELNEFTLKVICSALSNSPWAQFRYPCQARWDDLPGRIPLMRPELSIPGHQRIRQALLPNRFQSHASI